MKITPRTTSLQRITTETQINLSLNLDGIGKYKIQTPLGFLNHMLELFSKHSLIDLTIKATGDVQMDDHHLIEDVGIVLGQALKQALGNKKGIRRYGFHILPMDEVLCLAAVDLSGRYAFATDYCPIREKVNDFSTEMVRHFFEAMAQNVGMNLHLQFLNPGNNEHHRIEAAFKAYAKALRLACEKDLRLRNQLPTTKNSL